MIVAIHQPHFLPWLGYLHRMASVDLFVLLDHVQFERRNYQNRTLIRINGEARWLTVPVVQRSQKERVVDKEVDNRLDGAKGWAHTNSATLRHAYGRAPHFADYAPALEALFAQRRDRLIDINQAGLDLLREAFGIVTPLARSSDLAVEGARGDLILDICRAVGARTLLAGMGGSRRYLDSAAFARCGIEIALHDWRHPEYRQCGSGEFTRGLSAIDLLFNCGHRSREILFAGLGVAKAA
jgi:hypothetical protein